MKKLTTNHIIFFDENGKIDPYNLRIFLESQGFCLFQSHADRKVNKELVFNDNGVLKSYNSTELRRWITTALESIEGDVDDWIRVWIKYPDTSLRTSVIDHMTVYSDEEYPDTEQLETFRDTQEECYLKFRNGVVKITDSKNESMSYEELDGAIWESEIIPRDYGGCSYGSGFTFGYSGSSDENPFKTFIEKSVLVKDHSIETDDWREQFKPTQESEETLLSLKTGLGYLIHGFKNPKDAVAVLLMDRNASPGKANGGNGKSLILSSLQHLVKTATQGGKSFRTDPNSGGRFQFTNVDYDTKLININDLRPDFKLETLYNIITDDMEVERKNKNKFVIPSDRSPKVCASTNYIPLLDGRSDERRQHLIEIGDYWGTALDNDSTIEKELGKLLFKNDFTQTEWDNFFYFMIECVQSYLKHGLVKSTSTSYERKSLIVKIEGQDGDGEIVSWMDKWIPLHLNDEITEISFFDDFKKDYPFIEDWDVKRLHKGLYTYAMSHKDYDYNAHLKKNGDTMTQRRMRTGSSTGQIPKFIITRSNPLTLVA